LLWSCIWIRIHLGKNWWCRKWAYTFCLMKNKKKIEQRLPLPTAPSPTTTVLSACIGWMWKEELRQDEKWMFNSAKTKTGLVSHKLEWDYTFVFKPFGNEHKNTTHKEYIHDNKMSHYISGSCSSFILILFQNIPDSFLIRFPKIYSKNVYLQRCFVIACILTLEKKLEFQIQFTSIKEREQLYGDWTRREQRDQPQYKTLV